MSISWCRRVWLSAGVLVLAFLAGCGFQPLYGVRDGGQPVLARQLTSVAVKAPSTRTGFLVRRRLLYNLSPGGDTGTPQNYLLDIKLSQWEEDVLLQQDADVIRRNVVLEAYYTLTESDTNRYLYHSNNRAVAAYNRFDSEFANISAAQNAEARAAQTVADGIVAHLALYFEGNREAVP